MNFRIADTFTDSLTRLTAEEQKAVKTTAFDLQLDPSSPGLRFHKLDRAKDKHFWSVRVGSDIRLIVHRMASSLLLCYADHHDRAYAWAERRRLEIHPKTGAAQLVEIRERVEEVVVRPLAVREPAASTRGAEKDRARTKSPLFAGLGDDELLGYGVPPAWLADARQATEDTVLELADHLPAEAAEALLELAVGGTPRPRPVATPEPIVAALATSGSSVPPLMVEPNPFAHPDAQRRFRVVNDVDELARALEYPWDRWTIFLHPAQRELVERRFSGPARVGGAAGTGKTIVALHRAAHVARVDPDARVLLTTFSDSLAGALRDKLKRLIGGEPRIAERIEVDAMDTVARRLAAHTIGSVRIVERHALAEMIGRAAASVKGAEKFSPHFLRTEWDEVVDAWQLSSWKEYRDVARLGRKTRLPESVRQTLWGVFEQLRSELDERGLTTSAGLYGSVAAHLAAGGRSPYDFIVVDEAQDVSVAQLRFLAALGAERPAALFFAGDLGQRIFQLPFSWKSLGVDIRGRSRTLRVNYRTSHQIRAQADRLLGTTVTDVDGNTDERGGTVSVFNGPPPVIQAFDIEQQEVSVVGRWLADRVGEGSKAEEIGVFVRSAAELPRARAAVKAAGLPFQILDDGGKAARDRVSIGTMHLSKGLEFRTVTVMACDDEVLPLQSRVEAVTDDSDLEEVYETERHLLYVACTRARDHLLVTGVRPVSDFLSDLHGRHSPSTRDS